MSKLTESGKAFARLDNLLLKLRSEEKESFSDKLKILRRRIGLSKNEWEILKKVLFAFIDEILDEISEKLTEIISLTIEDYELSNKKLKEEIKSLKEASELRNEIKPIKVSIDTKDLLKSRDVQLLTKKLVEKNNFIHHFLTQEVKDVKFKILDLVKEKPMTVAEIAFKLNVSPGTVSKKIKELEKEGYLRKNKAFSPFKVIFISSPWD